MELVVREHFKSVPDDINELVVKFAECLWLDEYIENRMASAISKALNDKK
jgi:hypothetical protein